LGGKIEHPSSAANDRVKHLLRRLVVEFGTGFSGGVDNVIKMPGRESKRTHITLNKMKIRARG
jgi:hypothetical protein